jgi:hypothetical protein
MEEIYNSSYQHLAYDSAKRAIYITWKAASQEMNEITYQKELLNYIALLKQYKPLIYMNDLRKFLFTVTPDLQTWVSDKFQELYADPSMPTDTFSAIVMSQDFFAHVSIERPLKRHLWAQPMHMNACAILTMWKMPKNGWGCAKYFAATHF